MRQQRAVRRVSNELDEFHHYRRYAHSYYWSDDSRQDTIFIPMGVPAPLNEKCKGVATFAGYCTTSLTVL